MTAIPNTTPNRIQTIFDNLRAGGRARALMPFVCGGYPKPGLLGRIITAVRDAGAPIIEIGIPYSDPIADGPVIAAAMHDALVAGSTPRTVFDEVRQYRHDSGAADVSVSDPLVREMLGGSAREIGLVAMVSVSVVRRMGEVLLDAKKDSGVKVGMSLPAQRELAFCRCAAESGFDGLIVPDCPIDEADDLSQAAASLGLTLTHLISPSTPDDRAKRIAQASTGFIYLLARAGITGETAGAPDIAPRVAKIRQWTQLPIAVGFGISSADHVRHVLKDADAAIVGSALVKRMRSAPNPDRAVQMAGEYTAELMAATR